MMALAPVVESKPVSPLRQKLLIEMTVRHFAARTQEAYLHVIEQLDLQYRRMPDPVESQ